MLSYACNMPQHDVRKYVGLQIVWATISMLIEPRGRSHEGCLLYRNPPAATLLDKSQEYTTALAPKIS